MPRGFVRLLVGLAVTVAAGRASADLCGPTEDPCVVTASVTLPGGTIIDLGSRTLVLGGTCTLTVQGAGTLSITAGDITLQPGAKILAPGANGIGGSVILYASGAMLMGAGAKIDVSAGSAGDVTIVADHAQLDGSIRAEATTRDGDGGYVSLNATKDASIGGGGVDVNGGDRDGFGGFLDAFVGGDLRVTALLEAKGGEGSDLYLDAGGDLLIEPGGELTAIALTPLGDGGSVTLNAGGLVSVEGPVSLAGAGDWNEGGGDGGDIDISAERAVLSALIDMSGGHPDGSGGFFDIFATADVTMAGSLLVMGPSEGVGGDALIDTLGPITITGTIDVSGGYAGGSFEPSTRGAFELAPGAVVSVAGTPGSTFGGYGGTMFIEACDATLAGTLDASGLGKAPLATVQTLTGGMLTVSGVVEGPGGVTFHYRSEPPTITATASILPEPTIVQDPTIPCCGMCTTTTSSSSTTSTTIGTTSTTSSSSTTSTTVDTTSTTVASTTTTSTSSSTTTTTSTTTTLVTSTTTTTVATTTTTTLATSTSTTVTTSTSSTSTSSTSVVTTSTSSTTATTLPLSCLDEPLQGYAAVDCATTELQDMVAAQSEIALGGHKSARRLAGKITKTRKFVEKSRTSPRAVKLLVKAEKKVVSFETQIAKLLAQQKIDDALANELLALAGEVTARIDAVRTPPAS